VVSLLAHSSNINDLLEGLDGVLEDWLDGLHDTESSLHIVDLWLHALDGLHLSGDLNEWLSIIESLEDSGGEGLLDVLDGSGLGNGGVSISSSLGLEGRVELGLKGNKELILVHVLGLGVNEFEVVEVVVSGVDSGEGSDSGEFHLEKSLFIIKNLG
jgi:hypothetical protein